MAQLGVCGNGYPGCGKALTHLGRGTGEGRGGVSVRVG